MGIYSSVTCCETHGSAKESFGPGGVTANVTLKVAWVSRHALIQDLLLTNREWPHLATPALYATEAKLSANPTKTITVGQSLTYIDAYVDVSYKTREQLELPDGTLYVDTIKPAAEFIKVDNRAVTWDTPAEGATPGDPAMPVSEGSAMGKLILSHTLVRTMSRMPSIPVSVLSLTGTCNDTLYTSTSLGLTYPAETLLFQPPSITFEHLADGSTTNKLVLEFQYKPQTWNKFWRPDKQAWERLKVAATGVDYNNYPTADFSDFLF